MMTLWLRFVSLIVPRYRRAEWEAEWAGEMDARASSHARRNAGLARGALAHALWVRRLEWGFAAADARYALRLARRGPGFAAVVIATLGLGIGAATAMFSIVNGVLLKALPYAEPERLVYGFGAFRQSDSAAVSPMDFLDYRERNDAFDAFGAMMIGASEVVTAGSQGPERLRAATLTSGVITALGVPPLAGRDFTRDEERYAGPQSILISERVWRDRFASSPEALGQAITVDGRPRTIVGVMPAAFKLPYSPGIDGSVDLYLPFPFDVEEARVRGYHFVRVVGRMKPGLSLAAVQQHMDGIARQLEQEYPETNETWHLRLLPLQEQIVGGVRDTLTVMMIAVLLVLLIACANVAGLLVARAASRQGEVAVRRALGAPRARIVRQFLMEGAIFAAAGCAAGLCLALWIIGLVRRASPGNIPRLDEVAVDPTVVIFCAAAGMGTTLLFALLPALQASGRAHVAAIRDGARTSGSRAASRLRGLLVAGQVALATLLLVGAGLLTRSFVELTSVETGFAVDDVLVARLALPPQQYETQADVDRFFTELLSRLSAVPGIAAASLATTPPLTGGNDITTYPEGQPPRTQADRRFSQVRWVQGAYFDAAGIPLLKGRAFDDARDSASGPFTAVLSRAMADAYFQGADPIGRRIVADFNDPVVAEVIGVVGDARIFGRDSEPPDVIYLAARQMPTNFQSIVARTSISATDLAPVLRAKVRELDPTLALGRVETMRSLLDESVARPRFRMGLIVSFAAVALVLTLVGLYGTVAYAVSQRAREIGIRFALGAQARSVVGLVVRQGAWFVALGCAVGLAVALAASRVLQEMLFQVTPRDFVVFMGVPLVVAAVALAAMLAPARRASKVDPVSVLRA